MDSALFISILPQITLLLVNIIVVVAYAARLSRPPPMS